MKLLIVSLAAALLLVNAAAAETLYDGRNSFKTIAEYEKFLQGELKTLRSSDGGARGDTFEKIEESLEADAEEGEALFPLTLMGDYVTGAGLDQDRDADSDLEEDMVELLIDTAEDSNASLTRREMAAMEVARIVSSSNLKEDVYRSKGVDFLVEMTEEDNVLLAYPALLGLAGLVYANIKDNEALSFQASEALEGMLTNDNHELKRLAFLEIIEALSRASVASDGVELLWEALPDGLSQIESHMLKVEVSTHIKKLIASKTVESFQDEIDTVKEVLEDMNLEQDEVTGELEDVLEDLRRTNGVEEIESQLVRIVQLVKEDKSQTQQALSLLSSYALPERTRIHKIRAIGQGMVEISKNSESRMVFIGVAAKFLTLAIAHGNSDKAIVPLTQLSGMLWSTGSIGQVGPILDELRLMTEAKIPGWIKRRLIALLFVAAGDSISPAIRREALANLEAIAKTNPNWSLRYEALTRIRHLAQFANNSDVKTVAAEWK